MWMDKLLISGYTWPKSKCTAIDSIIIIIQLLNGITQKVIIRWLADQVNLRIIQL